MKKLATAGNRSRETPALLTIRAPAAKILTARQQAALMPTLQKNIYMTRPKNSIFRAVQNWTKTNSSKRSKKKVNAGLLKTRSRLCDLRPNTSHYGGCFMTQHDQLTFQNPVDRYAPFSPPKQYHPEPGFDEEIVPKADHGEESYRGTGRLEGRKALITGADSGIGAAVAIAFAREGADVALNYLPVEEEDAQHIIEVIRETGRKAVALPGDVRDEDFCTQLVEDAVRELGGLDALV